MKNWEELFKPWILERGQKYFEYGHVSTLKELGSTVYAMVSGSQLYHVEIQRDGDRVSHMSCDCPYALDSENCKHMAAVLFALDEKNGSSRMDWQNALSALSEQQVRNLLCILAETDRTLQNRIVRMVSGPGDDPAVWRTDLDQIVSNYTDYHGWLDERQAYDCMEDIAAYLTEGLPSVLTTGHVVDAAKLVSTVYEAAWAQDMDDSDGGLTVVSEACREAMEQILSLADTQQEQIIFTLFHEFPGKSDWCYGTDDLEDMILSLNWSQEFQQKNLEYLDANLDSRKMNSRAKLMERMGSSTEDIIAWWEQYRGSDAAYRPLLHLYEETDVSKAIQLVRDRRERETIEWRAADDTKVLLKLLKKTGNQSDYEQELRHLVMDLKVWEVEYLSQLRSCTPRDQWDGVFEMLLLKAAHPSERMRLLCFERMFPELFETLYRYSSFSSFLNYEPDLRSWNPERTLELYMTLLKQEMHNACDRKQYRHVVAHLCDLEEYPGGLESARTLAAFWHVQYKNRPAMRDELSRAGYPQEC